MPYCAKWPIGSRPESLFDGGVKLRTLSARDRLQLLKFVCSFVWADLEVKGSEKKFVTNMVMGSLKKSDRQPPAEKKGTRKKKVAPAAV